MADLHDFKVFALAAEVEDLSISVPVSDVVGFRSMPFNKRMKLGPLGLPLLSRKIRAFDPDLLHQHFATWSGPAIAVSKKGPPLLTTIHGYDIFVASRPELSVLDRWHLRNTSESSEHSSRILAVSEYLASRAIESGFDPSKLHVHYQGVDTEFFTPSPTRRVKTSPPTLLFVGGLFERKGVKDLLEASAKLSQKVEHSLLIVGNGPLKDLIDRYSLEYPHISHRSALNRDDLRDEMRAAHALVLPTQEHEGWREAAGLVLVEAQACGTPVIAYRSGGAPEMISENVSGLLVPEKNVEALTTAIRQVLTLPEAEYLLMRTAARSFAHENRSLEKSCLELNSHYAETVNLRRR